MDMIANMRVLLVGVDNEWLTSEVLNYVGLGFAEVFFPFGEHLVIVCHSSGEKVVLPLTLLSMHRGGLRLTDRDEHTAVGL